MTMKIDDQEKKVLDTEEMDMEGVPGGLPPDFFESGMPEPPETEGNQSEGSLWDSVELSKNADIRTQEILNNRGTVPSTPGYEDQQQNIKDAQAAAARRTADRYGGKPRNQYTEPKKRVGF